VVRWSTLLLSLHEAEVKVEPYSCLIQPLELLIFIYADLFLVLRRCLVKILGTTSPLFTLFRYRFVSNFFWFLFVSWDEIILCALH
jgi:hypothetical protein